LRIPNLHKFPPVCSILSANLFMM